MLPWLITGCDRADGQLFYVSFTDDKLHSGIVPALKENKGIELDNRVMDGWFLKDNSNLMPSPSSIPSLALMFIFPRPPNNCSLEASSITCPLIYCNNALVSLGMGVNGSSWRGMNNDGKCEDVTFLCRCFFAANCLGEVSMFLFLSINLN